MKENNFIVLIAVISLLSTFFLVYGAQGNYLAIIGTSVLDGWATQAEVSVSLRIGTPTISQSYNVSTSGTVIVARDNSFDDRNRGLNLSLSNLTSGWQVNVSAYGTSYPEDWTEPEPNSTQAGTTKFEYFEVKINQSVPNSSYMISFNMSQANLGSIVPDNVSLFMYNDTSTLWVNLTTEIINGTSDPALFFSIAPHFSKFFIGQKVQGTEPGAPGGGDVGGAPGQTGTPGGGGGGAAKPAEKEKEEEEIEEPPKPIRIPGNYFDVSVSIPSRYRTVKNGDELVAEVSIINIRRIGLMKINVEYSIEDKDGNIRWSQIETKAVENEITFLKEVELQELLPGYHMFFVRVTFEEDIALAGYPFKVVEEAEERVPAAPRERFDAALYLMIFFIFSIASVYVILLIRKKLPEGGKRLAEKKRVEKAWTRMKRGRTIMVQRKKQAPKAPLRQAKQKVKEAQEDYWDEMQQSLKKR